MKRPNIRPKYELKRIVVLKMPKTEVLSGQQTFCQTMQTFKLEAKCSAKKVRTFYAMQKTHLNPNNILTIYKQVMRLQKGLLTHS
jgi:hypothetical protein